MSNTRNGLTFEQWKAAVNAQLDATTGLAADDLPDVDYWCLWDAGVTPADAASEALESAGFTDEEN